MSDSPKGITPKASKINVLAAKSAGKEITPSQGTLPLGIEKTRDFGEIGMGVLSDIYGNYEPRSVEVDHVIHPHLR